MTKRIDKTKPVKCPICKTLVKRAAKMICLKCGLDLLGPDAYLVEKHKLLT